ncbi:hypothetical protein [Methylocystis bryophila]|uniref:Uncharacterized protein n=1 Tax=Methylocystis bryophila TaxID=655015 RepID=A0A1W6MS14_9HYPH|nr:hypothetical protein [Methylocystis bryophila]ARN80384.1 hypothetical protein B1812_04020 [Methylocystis bryophila]BDV40380.1 hypothetical protein DSM21852_36330 [Methylocystis bryophila]
MTDESEIWPTGVHSSAPSERFAAFSFARLKLSRPAQVAVVVYATMLVLLLANPRALVDWIADLPQNAITETARSAAEKIAEVSSRLGLSEPYGAAREAFLRSGWIKRDRGQR